jgi:hypothetical protein
MLGALEKYECLKKDDHLDDRLAQQRKASLSDPKYMTMMEFRKKLPSYQMREVTMHCSVD